MKKRASLLIVCLSLCLTAMAFAAEPGGNNAVKVVSVPGMTTDGNTSGSRVLNQDAQAAELVPDTRFDGVTIEKSIELVRLSLFDTVNAAESMVYKKRNAIKGDLQNFDIGSDKDIADLIAKLQTTLGIDKGIFSEKDEKAISMIPIGDTGYELPTDTEISVIGGSSIQAYPLSVDGKVIGHFRVVAGGYRTDDVIINGKAVSYCVVSMMTTGVTRTSDVHKNATTKIFFTGVSDPYVVGQVATVKINWDKQPKHTLEQLVNEYNINNVPHALSTLEYDTTITLSDGTELAGTNARVGKQ